MSIQMTYYILRFLLVILVGIGVCAAKEIDPEQLAVCMTDKGWVMYGAEGCSACATQRDYFGSAIRHIRVVYCHDGASDTHIEQCISNRIDYTPTWVLIVGGREFDRIEGYRSLEELARISGCG